MYSHVLEQKNDSVTCPPSLLLLWFGKGRKMALRMTTWQWPRLTGVVHGLRWLNGNPLCSWRPSIESGGWDSPRTQWDSWNHLLPSGKRNSWQPYLPGRSVSPTPRPVKPPGQFYLSMPSSMKWTSVWSPLEMFFVVLFSCIPKYPHIWKCRHTDLLCK